MGMYRARDLILSNNVGWLMLRSDWGGHVSFLIVGGLEFVHSSVNATSSSPSIAVVGKEHVEWTGVREVGDASLSGRRSCLGARSRGAKCLK